MIGLDELLDLADTARFDADVDRANDAVIERLAWIEREDRRALARARRRT